MVESFFVSSCLLDAAFFGMGFGPILEPKFLEESYAFILSLNFFWPFIRTGILFRDLLPLEAAL
jgi:hypothetical protein